MRHPSSHVTETDVKQKLKISKDIFITERSKLRNIDAPNIYDKPTQNILAKDVLLLLYSPFLISTNCSSVENKGSGYLIQRLQEDLRRHFKKYGFNGHLILIDFLKFFPTAPHNILFKRREDLIYDPKIRELADKVIHSAGDVGMPLWVKPSQIEMVAFAAKLDAYIKCQLSIKGYGKYMDDHCLLIPLNINPTPFWIISFLWHHYPI